MNIFDWFIKIILIFNQINKFTKQQQKKSIKTSLLFLFLLNISWNDNNTKSTRQLQ